MHAIMHAREGCIQKTGAPRKYCIPLVISNQMKYCMGRTSVGAVVVVPLVDSVFGAGQRSVGLCAGSYGADIALGRVVVSAHANILVSI